MSRRKNEMNLGEAIEHYLKSEKLYDRFKGAEVISIWEEVMGSMVAARTRKMYMKDRVLHVRLDSAVLRHELELGKDKLVKNINEHIGEDVLNSVRFI